MVKRHYNKTINWIEKNRFKLLLLCTALTLVLPAFSGSGILSEIIFVVTLSFLFIQSTVVANVRKSKKIILRLLVISLLILIWLKPVGYNSFFIEILKLFLFVAFFSYITLSLVRFIAKSNVVNLNVLITSINIYLLIGIIGASLCLAFYQIYPEAYNIPPYMSPPKFEHFLYYSFITMSTVGYGDFTPRIPETQTLAYFLSITGQLYVAIIIAFLIGKYLMEGDSQKNKQTVDKKND
jgi:voltage-gated potassium channel